MSVIGPHRGLTFQKFVGACISVPFDQTFYHFGVPRQSVPFATAHVPPGHSSEWRHPRRRKVDEDGPESEARIGNEAEPEKSPRAVAGVFLCVRTVRLRVSTRLPTSPHLGRRTATAPCTAVAARRCTGRRQRQSDLMFPRPRRRPSSGQTSVLLASSDRSGELQFSVARCSSRSQQLRTP